MGSVRDLLDLAIRVLLTRARLTCLSNLAALEIGEIKVVPHSPVFYPLVERGRVPQYMKNRRCYAN